MKSFILKRIFPVYLTLVLLDLNEFVSGFLGLRGVLSVLILLLSIFLIVTARPNIRPAKSVHGVFIFFFLGYLTLGSLASFLEGNVTKIWPSIRYYMPSLLIYYATYRTVLSIRNNAELFKVFRITAMLISINAVLILVSIFFGVDFQSSTDGARVDRAVGLYSNANRAGYVSVIGQLLTIVVIVSGQFSRKWLFLFMYLICLGASVSTFSKGSIILSLVTFSVLFFLARMSSRSLFSSNLAVYTRRIALILIIIVPFSFSYLYSNLTVVQVARIQQVGQLLSGEINDQTTTRRSGLATYALNQIEETFYLGAGLGEFKRMTVGKGTHNVYLLILGESGVIALVLYLYFILFWFSRSFRGKKTLNPIAIASLGLAMIITFAGFASHTVLANKSFIIVLGILFAATRIKRQFDLF